MALCNLQTQSWWLSQQNTAQANRWLNVRCELSRAMQIGGDFVLLTGESYLNLSQLNTVGILFLYRFAAEVSFSLTRHKVGEIQQVCFY